MRSLILATFLILSICSSCCFAENPSPSPTPTEPPAATQQDKPDPTAPYFDINLPIDKRVDDLIKRMTVDEKISQLMMTSPAIPRLGVNGFGWWSEALHGVARRGVATVFPQAIALAATWDPELHHSIARVVSTEVWAKNNVGAGKPNFTAGQFEHLSLWSPNINIFRDPRWGRGQETYGEDPFLTSRFGIAYVTGLQGDDPRYLQTVATVKHFAVHSGPESLRHSFNAVVSERDLHETYLVAFEACVREAHPGELMSAYNAIDGIPAPANHRLLTDILRGDWGFTGAVVGDVDTVSDITGGHHYSKDAAEASAMAIKAGNDLCSGRTYEALPESLKRGLVTEADLDRALHDLFRLRFRLGQFDPPDQVPFTKIPASENDSPAHEQLALRASEESMVLLKNDGTLPWDIKSIKNLAIIGPTGDDNDSVIGNYAGTPSHPVTLVQGLTNRLKPLNAKVTFEPAVPLVEGFNVKGDPIPSSALFQDKTLAKHGLDGALYADSKFSGTPKGHRTDDQVNLFWNEAQPVADIPTTGAVIRWKGVLVPPASGNYVLSVSATGGFRLHFDGKSAPDAIGNKSTTTKSVSLALEANHPYEFNLDYVQNQKDGKIALCWQTPGADQGLTRALAAAKEADHIVLTLGITPSLEGESMRVDAPGFNGGDRTSILLPKIQQDLIDQVAALGKPFVVVLTNGSALSFDVKKPNAILDAWYYGEQGGNALANILLGDFNPAGRLPITFYQADTDLPEFTDYSMANRTYRYFKGTPLFAFGYGLSYTTFQEDSATLSAAKAKPADSINVTVNVKNTGTKAGDEVVQIYAHAEKPPVPMPNEWLVGFQRITLNAGESKPVTIPIKAQQLRRWDETKKAYVVDPGVYDLRIGSSSDHVPLTENLEITQ